MGLPEAQEATEQFRKQLNNADATAAREMVRSYRPVYKQLQAETEELLEIAAQKQLKPWQVMRLERMKDLERQYLANVTRWADNAGDLITNAQREAVGLARRGSRAIASAGLPQGVNMNNLAQLGLGWNDLPEDAFANFVGISGKGEPVGRLLRDLGPKAALDVRNTIGNGIALGKGPRQTARMVTQASGMPLSKAMVISRTETNRAYREATRLQYATNSQVVKGYRRSAAKSGNTCMACIALDGTQYGLDEPLNEHPNGRCALVPDVLDYADLGLDIPRETQPPSARDWFGEQSKDLQRQMLGPTRYRAYESGQLELADLVEIKSSSVWGDTAVLAPVDKIMVGKTGPGLVKIPLTEWIEAEDILSKETATKAAKKAAQNKVTKIKAAKPEPITPAPSKYDSVINDLDELPAISDEVMRDEQLVNSVVRQNREAIRATEEGEELMDAIHPWTSGDNEYYRAGAEAWVKGEPLPNIGGAQGATLAEAVSVAPPIPVPVHRGISVRLPPGETIENLEDLYKQGTTFDQHISSYSTSLGKAQEFTRPLNVDWDLDVGVIFNVEPGARGLNVESVSNFVSERERIVSGRFEVIGVRRVSQPKGALTRRDELHIDIRQIATLTKEKP